jgi:hypothetical protein
MPNSFSWVLLAWRKGGVEWLRLVKLPPLKLAALRTTPMPTVLFPSTPLPPGWP